MRLALINAESGKGGGPATICNDIYYSFANDNEANEALVCYGRQCNDKTDVNRYKIGNKLDLAMHFCITRFFDAHGLGSVYATKKLVKRLKEFDPDVVNLHNIHGYYVNYEILFRYFKEANIPVVWTLHDCWPFTGHCAYFDLAGCEKWQNHCRCCPQKKSYPASWFLDRSYSNFDRKKELFLSLGENLTIVTPSKWLADLVKESFLKDCSIQVINNGIDVDTFKPLPSNFKQENGISDKRMVLALASEWTTRKGFEDIKYIGTQLPDDYKMVMVGLQPEQLAEVPDDIIAITRTDNITQLIEIYSAADVFVNASVEDNFPTVILESLACGTPVVTYDTGGCREQINEKTGILVEKYAKDKLIEGIISFGTKGELTTKDCVDMAQSFEKKKMYSCYNKLIYSLNK